MTDQMTPHDIQLEEALLGCPLIDPEAFRVADGIIKPRDFYIVKNSWVWEAYQEIISRGEAIDYVVLCNQLELQQKLAEIGGAAYITRLVNAVPSALHVIQYARRVAELAERRRAIGIASEIAKAAYNENGEFPAKKAQLAMQLQKDGGGRRKVVSVRDAMFGLFDEVEYNLANPLQPGQVRHLSTGINDLDKLLGGVAVGLHYVAAVTSTGKTAFCLAIAANVARRGERVLFVSPEMPPQQLIERLVCAEGRIDSDWIDNGMWPDDDSYARFIRLSGQIADWPISILQSGDIQEIQAQAYYIEPRLIVLDGVERLEGGTRDATHERRGEIALWAHNLAIDPDIMAPVILPTQIAVKKVEDRSDKRPQLGDVYHTSEIDYITMAAITLHRRDRWLVGNSIERNHELEVTLWKHRAKKRNVPSMCTLRFGEYGEVTDLARQEVRFG